MNMFLFHSYYAKQNKYIPQEKVINHHLWKEMCIPFFVCKKEKKNPNYTLNNDEKIFSHNKWSDRGKKKQFSVICVHLSVVET